MDAAAEIIRTELRAILPDKPHQLAKTIEWISTDDGPKDPYARDEFRVQRLQYMTFSSEADRGIVFTRGYDDIRPGPKPMPRDVNALARSGVTKKRSLNDYINQKKSVASSPDPSSTPRKDISAPVTPVQERLKPPPTDTSSGRLKTASDSRDSAKSLPLKPPPGLPPKPPTPDDSKKRRAQDDGPRDKKRSRPSDVEPLRGEREKEDRTRNIHSQDNARDEPPRRKAQESTVSRDSNISKEKEKEKPIRDQASALPNGRSILKATTSSRPSSPPRARGNSTTNGFPGHSESARGSARNSKGDSQKPNALLPKLLSPLRLSFNESEKVGSDTNRVEKKRRPPDDGIPPKATTTEPRSSSKGPSVPPLLSPTLPPLVEAELERIEKSSQKEASSRPKGKEQDRDHDRDRDQDKEKKKDATGTTKPSSMVVTLKLPKNLRQQYRLMMKITRSALGGAQRAEKRPVSSGEPASEALKRPSTASKAPPAPSTPSKKGAQAMSRVSSNNSMAQVHTPSDAAIAATPSVPGSGERNSSNQPELREKDRERIQLLKDKEIEFKNLGRSLKHKSDAILLPRRDQHATNGTQPRSQSEVKLAWAQLLESLLCFVSSFHCADVQRALLNRSRDSGSWNSLGPLTNTLDNELRHNRSQRDAPMVALKTLLQLVANDQFLAAVASQSEPSPDHVSKLMRCERLRIGLLAQLRKANGAIESSSLRANVTPWALEDTLADMLRVTKRWCADENVKWSPVLSLKDCGLRE